MTEREILQRLKDVKEHGSYKMAKCPAHKDNVRSLSIKTMSDGKVTIECYAGCDCQKICDAIGINISDLYNQRNKYNPINCYLKQGLTLVDEYNYCYDSFNDGLVKYKFIDAKGDKTFRWIHADATKKSGYSYSKQDTAPRLYVAGKLADQKIFIVEGEKDANTLHRIYGVTAVSVQDGATKTSGGKWLEEYSEQLRSKDVYILFDNDEVGRSFSDIEADNLFDYAKSITKLDITEKWKDCPEKGDISDMVKALGTETSKQILDELMVEAVPIAKEKKLNKEDVKKDYEAFQDVFSAEELLKAEFAPLEVIVGVGEDVPILTEGTCILSAKPKLGKSWLALCLCKAVSEGADFLGYKTRKSSVLYLDLETVNVLKKQRLSKVYKDKLPAQSMKIVGKSPILGKGLEENLIQRLEADPELKLIVIDVFQKIRTPRKNSTESEYEHSYRDLQPLNDIAEKYHVAIMIICHDRKMTDPQDPFANILGSTGLQGAVYMMWSMFKPTKSAPITLAVKGKTIDGCPELHINIANGGFYIVKNPAEEQNKERIEEFESNPIREGIIKLVDTVGEYKGRCSGLIDKIYDVGIGLECTPKELGGWISKNKAFMLNREGITITTIDNGTGPKIYRISKSPLMTIDETDKQYIENS